MFRTINGLMDGVIKAQPLIELGIFAAEIRRATFDAIPGLRGVLGESALGRTRLFGRAPGLPPLWLDVRSFPD